MKTRFFLLAMLAGLPGVLLIAWLVLPQMLQGQAVPVPIWVLQLAAGAQSTVLLALAVWVGMRLADKVGLQAPLLTAMAQRQSPWPSLRRLCWPGLIGGLLGGVWLVLLARFAPAELLQVQQAIQVPLIAKMLYGGITEELLIRWGLMTLATWAIWRSVGRRRSAPSAAHLYAAIAVSALMFGLGHLPALIATLGAVTPSTALFVVFGNTVFGLVAGWLFWRCGLEAAMLAHAIAHLVAHTAIV
ncbi:CPBP family intramembrane metalloprotease [Paucibacter sp. O1-1]|nr:CPBP family intramembrane metalloprotease [Paucibacter sp. O1-1]MDA3825466.1 CPBP family intramembrane metalloprotease [Paucibacter sp. O1-1]